MFRIKWLVIPSLLAAVLILNSCGPISGGNRATDVADAFYNFQLSNEAPFPYDIFSEKKVADQAIAQIERREIAYGAYVSHKRTGTNRRVSIDGRNRKESITYIFEVTGQNGKTRETLMLSRKRKSDPFLISAYIIEDIPRLQDPAPAGTSST